MARKNSSPSPRPETGGVFAKTPLEQIAGFYARICEAGEERKARQRQASSEAAELIELLAQERGWDLRDPAAYSRCEQELGYV